MEADVGGVPVREADEVGEPQRVRPARVHPPDHPVGPVARVVAAARDEIRGVDPAVGLDQPDPLARVAVDDAPARAGARGRRRVRVHPVLGEHGLHHGVRTQAHGARLAVLRGRGGLGAGRGVAAVDRGPEDGDRPGEQRHGRDDGDADAVVASPLMAAYPPLAHSSSPRADRPRGLRSRQGIGAPVRGGGSPGDGGRRRPGGGAEAQDDSKPFVCSETPGFEAFHVVALTRVDRSARRVSACAA